MKLHTKNNRWGLVRGAHFLKIQLGRVRLYISTLPMKPKYESVTRRSFRRSVLESYGSACARCGAPLTLKTLSLHHIRPRSEFPELVYDPDNCMALCKACHIRLHQIRNRNTASMETTLSVNPAAPTAGDMMAAR